MTAAEATEEGAKEDCVEECMPPPPFPLSLRGSVSSPELPPFRPAAGLN